MRDRPLETLKAAEKGTKPPSRWSRACDLFVVVAGAAGIIVMLLYTCGVLGCSLLRIDPSSQPPPAPTPEGPPVPGGWSGLIGTMIGTIFLGLAYVLRFRVPIMLAIVNAIAGRKS